MATVLVKDLIEAGVHFGHRASRWNPKMRPYIYARRNLIHIIDVRETIRGLLRARKYLQRVAAGRALRFGVTVIAGGPGTGKTHTVARLLVAAHHNLFLLAAERLGMPAANCIVIEDSEVGIQAAQNAGMKAMRFYDKTAASSV